MNKEWGLRSTNKSWGGIIRIYNVSPEPSWLLSARFLNYFNGYITWGVRGIFDTPGGVLFKNTQTYWTINAHRTRSGTTLLWESLMWTVYRSSVWWKINPQKFLLPNPLPCPDISAGGLCFTNIIQLYKYFSLYFQCIQITATTPTSNAVRLETGSIELELSNRVQTATMDSAVNKHTLPKLFVKMQVGTL